MNIYEEIDQETMMLLLDSLCKRTVEGKQIWENKIGRASCRERVSSPV